MKTVTENQPHPVSVPSYALETFSATLRDGRVVTIREMTGKDLIYIEDELEDMKETKRSFHIIERLNVGDHRLSYEDVESLGVKDIKKISDLIGKANGDDEAEGKDPK